MCYKRNMLEGRLFCWLVFTDLKNLPIEKSYIAGMKVTVSHQPSADQISDTVTHFLVYLTYFRSNKRLSVQRR